MKRKFFKLVSSDGNFLLARNFSILTFKIFFQRIFFSTSSLQKEEYKEKYDSVSCSLVHLFIIIFAYMRLTHFNVSIYKIMAYLNIANGFEPESIDLAPNRSVALVSETIEYLNSFKNDDFSFEKVSKISELEDIRESLIYNKLNLNAIKPNFELYQWIVKLNGALMHIVVKGSLIMYQSTDSLNGEHYKNTFTKINSSDSLTRLERNIYFVFANSLNSIHKTLSETGPLIYNICESVRDKQNKNLIIIHIITYLFLIICGIIFIPIILKIQKNKRNLLLLFAELPLSSIKEISQNCKLFIQHNLHADENPNEESNSNKNY